LYLRRYATRHGDEGGQEGICGERWANFPSVSPVHRGNDGLCFDVDCLTIPFSKWRTEALKAYGNAIVPQVMYEIFRAIEQVELQW
jgi:DNA (cytosine-5)-methyltransferase 1